jgi:hypothetical protein
VNVEFLRDFFARCAPDLGDRWHYLFLHEKSFGMSRERFDESLALILRGLRTGVTGGAGGKHYDFPEISLTLRPMQVPNPPMWYAGNPTVAGRYGFGLVWPGAIPQDAYDLYVSTWDKYKDDISPIYLNYVGFEAGAAFIRQFQTGFIPALLQTPEYSEIVTNVAAVDPRRDRSLVRLRLAKEEIEAAAYRLLHG